MKKDKKNEIVMITIIGLVCVVLFAIMFMQFKTIEETDITAIENMREAELRTAISEWKGKYEETEEQLQANIKLIQEYKESIEKDEQASELIDQDLKNSNRILGKTNVHGQGVTITIEETDGYQVNYYDLLDLVNELRYAGAEAISINGVRILSSTYITQPQEERILIDGQRVTSPFVVKAIGNQTYLSSTLSLKDTGYIDKYKAVGMNIKLITGNNIEIPKYSGTIQAKYMKEGEKE